jgi:hypothetical protein
MRRAVLVILVVAAMVGCLFLLRRTEVPPSNTAPPDTAGERSESNGVTKIETFAPLINRDAKLQKPPGVDERSWQNLLKVRRELLSRNKPVEFHAKVIDQFGGPVSGAVAKGKLSRNDEEKLSPENFLRLKPGEETVHEALELTSDDNGWIRLTDRKGEFIVIESLERPGYEWRFEKYLIFNYVRPNRSDDFKDRNKGFVFHVWKIGKTEALLPFHFGVPVNFDASNWYALDFFRGVIPSGEGGDFRFWFRTTNDVNGNPARLFRFENPSGGLQLVQDAFPYEAPIDGYVREMEWMYEPQGRHSRENPQDVLVKQFYVRSRQGKIYAALTWNFSGGGIADIRGYVNPFGSRNLEPNPEKQITDPDEIRRLDKATRVK